MRPLTRALAAVSIGTAILGAFAGAILYAAAAAPAGPAVDAPQVAAPVRPFTDGGRRTEIAGWQVEDVAEPQDGNPGHRVVRMSRAFDGGSIELIFETGSQSRTPWQLSHGVNLGDSNHVCSSGSGTTLEGGSPAERARQARTAVMSQIEEAAQRCEQAPDQAAAALAGFDAAFALLSGWHEQSWNGGAQ